MLIGTAVGTIIGIVLAPRNGRQTRQILKKSAAALPELAEDLSTTLQLQADRLSDSALNNWDSTLVRLKEAVAAGIEASHLEATDHRKPSEVDVNSPLPNSDNQSL